MTATDAIRENTELFLEEVGYELERARVKFPSSNLVLAALIEEVGELAAELPDDAPHMRRLTEKVGALAQAMLKVRAGKWSVERIYEEAVQVAAMACRVAVEGDPSFSIEYTEPDPIGLANA